MKLNNKGFAVSIILYSMIAVITIVLLLVLSIYSTNIHNKLTQAERIKEKLSNLNTLTNKVLGSNTVQTGNLRLNRDSSYDNSRGLYKSIVTNSGKPVYFFRGNVTNNYVEFAGMLWRIVRINEDKTVKIVLDTSIGPNKYYNSSVTHNYPASSYYDGSTYGTYPVRHDIYYSNLSNSQEIKKLLDILKKMFENSNDYIIQILGIYNKI